nr:PREDICTED: N-acetyltransferase ESCO2 [Bemisia tabaci]
MTGVIDSTPASPVRRRPKNNFEPSPFRSERKRKLFPTESPHGSDLSEITPLSPVSEDFSPSKSKVVVRTPLVPTIANQNVTPKKSKNSSIQESPRRSPRIAQKQVIKTSSFYGRSLLSEFSKTTSPLSELKAKHSKENVNNSLSELETDQVKGNENKPSKRAASEPLALNPAKRRCSTKPRGIFSGVGHAIKKPKPPPEPKFKTVKLPPLRQNLKNKFDFTKTPYSLKKNDANWSYAGIHRERTSLDSSEAEKRKFFKSSVGKISVVTPPSSKKKIKLFKVQADEILADPGKTASEWLDEIEGTAPLSQNSSNVCDLTESTSNLSIEDAVQEPDTPMRELANQLEEEPSPTPKVYPVFNFKKMTPKSASPTKRDSAKKGVKKIWKGLGENQLLLDAGQKRFGATQCSECGLMYEPGDAEDEIQHAKYHSEHKALRYPGYKNERIVGRCGLDYIVCFTGLDSKMNQNKILSVLDIVDKELGFDTPAVKIYSKSQVYLYISDKQIAGCLVVEPLSEAYKMLISDEEGVDVCSTETYKVKCGISRIWTRATDRRKGIATQLTDCVRRNFFYGSILAQEDIAFSVPTVDGKKFARKYTGKEDYFVYTGWPVSNSN